MFRMVFVLFAVLQSAPPISPGEIKDALSYADALYYNAHFSESLSVLTRIDQALISETGRQQEKIDTKLRLALTYIGMNDTAKAKASFMDLYGVAPDYAIDEHQYSPKVNSLATEARAEQTKVRCYEAQTEARTYVDNGDTVKFISLLGSMGSKCTVLAALAPQAAETSVRRGIAQYKAADFSNALSSFEEALALAPEHDLAREYADLTRDRLKLLQTISPRP
ncbi:MAG TPA: hypothetical protein VKY31_11955 [Terriglobia bacterium]|nr:hypothetical protein [Terriglobia bacterium]